MEIGTLVHALTNFMKAIVMKLTHEGSVFCLLTKIARHYSFGKCIGQVDSECLSMGLPRDDAFIADRGHLFKHVVEFDRKQELWQRETVSNRKMAMVATEQNCSREGAHSLREQL
jgi:hypothetical protein